MGELELYIHIPFCVQKCAYCDFLSAPADKEQRQEYVRALLAEIQRCGTEHGGQYQVSSIFMGGGTPSILEGYQIVEIFQALHQAFQIQEDVEITIEVNPGTVCDDKLLAWRQAGINRLSIGLQSTDNQELRLLGRIHTYEVFLETYQNARKAGFANINVDLISAIPGQTEESWSNTLKQVAELKPEHISAYSLIIEESTPFYELYGDVERTSLPDEETERKIYCMTEVILQEYGYSRYEISNYARAGYECRHNKGYWERKEYLGMGLGAASLMGHQRFHNTEEYDQYIEGVRKNEEIRRDIETLSVVDEMEEFMFLGLRETNGISVKRFEHIFKQSIFEIYKEPLEKLERQKLIKHSGDTIALTARGLDVSNAVFVEFMEPII